MAEKKRDGLFYDTLKDIDFAGRKILDFARRRILKSLSKMATAAQAPTGVASGERRPRSFALFRTLSRLGHDTRAQPQSDPAARPLPDGLMERRARDRILAQHRQHFLGPAVLVHKLDLEHPARRLDSWRPHCVSMRSQRRQGDIDVFWSQARAFASLRRADQVVDKFTNVSAHEISPPSVRFRSPPGAPSRMSTGGP
jgi:hypothetical protein